MSEHSYGISEIAGSSTASFDDAIRLNGYCSGRQPAFQAPAFQAPAFQAMGMPFTRAGPA